MQDCHDESCERCKELKTEIITELNRCRRPVDAELARRLDEADENRSYLNNSGFMEWYWNKYGFDKGFEFLVHDDLVFVVVVDNGVKTVVTCVSAKTHLAGKASARPKFSRKEG